MSHKRERLSEQLAVAQAGREESDERMRLLEELDLKRALKNKLIKELQEYKSCDPQHMAELSML